MTPITAGMTPAQFNTAMNANIASVGFTGRAVDFTTLMLGHEIKTAFALDSLGTLNFGRDANFISNLNNTFNNISLADKVIAGAVDVKTIPMTKQILTLQLRQGILLFKTVHLRFQRV
jgi:hypothetical protein